MKPIHARRAYLGGGRWLDSALIEIDSAGRIADLRAKKPAEAVRRFHAHDGIALPGLINVHTHLEYSALQHKIPAGLGFADWIRAIGPLKDSTPRPALRAAAQAQIRQLIENGVTAVGDHCALDVTPELWGGAVPDVICFYELLEFLPRRAEAAIAEFERRRAQFPDLEFGYAPHAPYSAAPQLLQWARRQSLERRRPLAIHAAESLDEMEFFERGAGPLAELKRELGTLPPDWRTPGISPVRYLARLGVLAPHVILTHVTYPRPGDLELIQASGCSVVFCPGTHQYFGRGEYPLGRLLQTGINVCVGTDSLASNAELDLRRELRIARQVIARTERNRHDPSATLSAEALLDFVTVNPGRALGWNDRGMIAVGNRADLALWRVAQPDLECWLEDQATTCASTWKRGGAVWTRPE